MSFTEKMMAKMGHVHGQGLGKDNSEIVQPIQASNKQGQTGLGYDNGFSSSSFTTIGREDVEHSKVVRIRPIPWAAGPAYFEGVFHSSDYRLKEVKVYYLLTNKEAVAIFNSEEDAKQAVKDHHTRCHNGYYDSTHEYCKLDIQLVPESQIPTDKDCLFSYDFHRKRESFKKMKVLFTHRPDKETRKIIQDICTDGVAIGLEGLYICGQVLLAVLMVLAELD